MLFKVLTMMTIVMVTLSQMCFSQSEEKTMKPEQKNPRVLLKTNMGLIQIELYPEKAPKTVENFMKYVTAGHYDNTLFHRVIDGFMIQGGGMDVNFKQKPTGGPIKIESNNSLKNVKGSVAMARTSDPDSATAQFFINDADNDYLDYKSSTPSGWGYTVFGKVIEGMDVVDKISKVKTGRKDMHNDVPVENVVIESAVEVKP